MEQKLKYRLITGKDDAGFCERVSKLIDEGYVLHGSPSCTCDGKDVIVAQAVILPDAAKEHENDAQEIAR